MEQSRYEHAGTRYAQLVLRDKQPLREQLARTTEIWTRLRINYPNEEARSYLQLLAKHAPYLVLLLLPRLSGRNPLSEEEMDSIRATLVASCTAKLDKLSAEPASDPEKRLDYVREFLAKSARDSAPRLPKELTLLTKYVAAALLLEEEELIERALRLVQRTVESFGDLPEELEEFTIDDARPPVSRAELDQMISQQMSGRMVGFFAEGTLDVLRLGLQPLDAVFQFYQYCYQILPKEWNSSIAYNQYGTVTPLEDPLPTALVTLVRRAVEDHQLLYAYLLLKFFVPVHLSQLGYTLQEFLELVFAATETFSLFRGLLLAEKLVLLDADTEIEGIERWWSALCAAIPAESGAWREQEGWFHTYHLCRCIAVCPERAGEFLEKAGPLTPGNMVIKKNTAVQEAAMEALFTASDQEILRFLEVLGEHNVFRFDPQEKVVPYLDFRVLRTVPEQAVNGLLRQRFSVRQLVDIYMNTYLRCQMAPGYFLQLLVRGGVTLGFANSKTRMVIAKLFQPYVMLGDMRQGADGKFGLIPHNFRLPHVNRLLPIITHWQQKQDICLQLVEKNEPVPFHLVHFDLMEGNVFASLDNQEWMSTMETEGFQRLCAELENISNTGRFAEEENHRIKALLFLSLPQLEEADLMRVGLLMVRCCAALSHSFMSVRYFLNMMNILRNPFRFQAPGKRKQEGVSLRVDPDALTDGQRALLKEQWDRIMGSGLTMEQTFYVYVNTMIHLCMPLSHWADQYADNGEILDLVPVMTAPSLYRFTGKVLSVRPDRNPDRDYLYVQIMPDDLYVGAQETKWGRPDQRVDRFTFRTQGEAFRYRPGQYFTFVIRSYDHASRIFRLDTADLYDKGDTEGLSKPFFNALTRAANRTDLTERDVEDLRSDPGTINERTLTRMMGLFASALKRRQKSVSEINQYLETLDSNNFWRFGDKLPPLKKHLPANMVHSLPYTLRCVAEQDVPLSSPLQLYFNTPIRSCLPLNKAMELLLQAGRDLSALPTYMQDYPLLVRLENDQQIPVNFVGDHLVVMDLPAEAEEGATFSCLMEGYDQESDTLYLRVKEY